MGGAIGERSHSAPWAEPCLRTTKVVPFLHGEEGKPHVLHLAPRCLPSPRRPPWLGGCENSQPGKKKPPMKMGCLGNSPRLPASAYNDMPSRDMPPPSPHPWPNVTARTLVRQGRNPALLVRNILSAQVNSQRALGIRSPPCSGFRVRVQGLGTRCGCEHWGRNKLARAKF